MELEHLEVKILNALRNLGPPQIQQLAERADYQAHCFTAGLGVAYVELGKLAEELQRDRTNRHMQESVRDGMSLVFSLHERLNNRPAIMNAMLEPEQYAGREVMLGLLAHEMSLVWKEVARDRYELKGYPDKESEGHRLAPELHVLECAEQEAVSEAQREAQWEAIATNHEEVA